VYCVSAEGSGGCPGLHADFLLTSTALNFARGILLHEADCEGNVTRIVEL
jgi:hypothetical protein